jgi:hypothetical protein
MVIISEAGIRDKTIRDHHAAVAAYVLEESVPERVRVSFETAKNIYLYAWFVYRFYAVCRTYVYSCLELALRERFGRDLHRLELKEQQAKPASNSGRRSGRRVPASYDDYRPGLRRLLSYAVSGGHVKNEGFEVWRVRERVRAAERDTIEAIAREAGTAVVWEEDSSANFIGSLVDAIPQIRNEHAHGTSALDSNVLGSLRTVCEIINQIYQVRERDAEK